MRADHFDALRAAVLDFYGSADKIPADTACAALVTGRPFDGQQLGGELAHLSTLPGGETIAAAHAAFARNFERRHPTLPDDSL